MLKSETIKRVARQVGFDLCGVAAVRELTVEREFFERWLSAGYDSGLTYLRRNIEKRFSPELLMPGARSVIVCAVNYKNDTSLGYSEHCAARIASFARAADYHATIKAMLAAMAAKLREESDTFAFRTFSDTAPLLEKRWAVEAGLGFIGRNSLLVSPEYGSFLLLGELVVDAVADRYDSPIETAGCGECRRCVEICPNGAITPLGIDTGRCIARLTIEKPVARDIVRGDCRQETLSLNGWVYGCDECQSVCPYNKNTPYYRNPSFAPLLDPREMSEEDLRRIVDDKRRY